MKKMIKITEKEYLHLVNAMGTDRSLSTSFGPGGVYVDSNTERWALIELAKLRGVKLTNNED